MGKEQNVTHYFPHDSNARNSDKLIRLRMRHKAAGYGVYFMILERLREEPEYMSVKDYNMIAFDLREDASMIKSVVEDFGLFVFTEDGKYFYSESFKRRMVVKDEKTKKRSEAGGKSAAQKWGNTEREDLSPSKLRSKRLSIAREKGTHTNEEWEELKEFFGECVICGSKERIVKDHIVPIYQGGSDAITNLQPLCNSCNSRKGSDNKDYRTEWCKAHNIEMPDKWLTKTEKWLTNKQNQTKEKENNISHTNARSTVQDDIPVKTSFAQELRIEECRLELLSNQSWIEQLSMNVHAAGHASFTVEMCREYINSYFMELQNRGVERKDIHDAMSHFASWLKIELKNQKDDTRRNHRKPDAKPPAKSAGIQSFVFGKSD